MSGAVPGPVVFDYALWSARYPEFVASVSRALAQAYFGEACLYLNNTASSPVTDNAAGGTRTILLNMLVAHIAALNAPIDGQPSPSQVGRISQASEGGVSVTFDMGTQPGTAAWFQQTKYGAAFWQATAPYRTMRYRAGPQPYLGVGGPWGAGAQASGGWNA